MVESWQRKRPGQDVTHTHTRTHTSEREEGASSGRQKCTEGGEEQTRNEEQNTSQLRSYKVFKKTFAHACRDLDKAFLFAKMWYALVFMYVCVSQ